MITSKSSAVTALAPLRSHARLLIPVTSAAMLAACVTATAPLWRSYATEQNDTPNAGAALAENGDIYQAFQQNGNLWLRKLNSNGTEQWRKIVGEDKDAALSYDTRAVIPAAGGVVVLYNKTQGAWFDADGTLRWNQQVVPAGNGIKAWSRATSDRLFISYGSDWAADEVEALDLQGNIMWSYPLKQDATDTTTVLFDSSLAVQDTGEVLVNLTARTGDTSAYAYAGKLVAIDSQGNLINSSVVNAHATLMDNENSAFLKEGGSVSRLDFNGNRLWSWQVPTDKYFHYEGYNIPCTGDGDQVIACAYWTAGTQSSGSSIEVTWLSGEGQVQQQSSIPTTTSLGSLQYNGDHKWLVTRLYNADVPPIYPFWKITEYQSLIDVLSDQGTVLQTINLAAYQLKSYLNFMTGTWYWSGEVSKDGDDLGKVLATPTQVYAIGNKYKAKRGFVSAYAIKQNE